MWHKLPEICNSIQKVNRNSSLNPATWFHFLCNEMTVFMYQTRNLVKPFNVTCFISQVVLHTATPPSFEHCPNFHVVWKKWDNFFSFWILSSCIFLSVVLKAERNLDFCLKYFSYIMKTKLGFTVWCMSQLIAYKLQTLFIVPA